MAVYEVEGGRRLRATLRQAGDDLQGMRDAHRDASQIAANAAAALAPVRSGRLRATVRAAGTKTAGIIRAGFARVPYAGPVHWGWPRRNIPANTFLSDGAKSTEPRWLPVYMKHVEQALDKIEGARS